MDPKYTGETLKHLEKQKELLVDAHKSMTNELHTLKVEEEMLMRKLYELMTANAKKAGSNKDPQNGEDKHSKALVKAASNDE